jgi:hypothetical protein
MKKGGQPPRICEREGAPYAPVRERERSAENKKRKKKRPKGVTQSKGTSQSDVGERAHPKARCKGRGRL